MRIQHKRARVIALTTIGVLAIAASIVGGYLLMPRETDPIPTEIQNELTFSPLIIPTGTKGYSTSHYKLEQAEKDVRILTYLLHVDGGPTVSVSEYTQPSQFTEIPEYKDHFLTDVAKQYDTVPTANGTIYLGRITKQNNKQLGVMLERGLIVFLNPDSELDKTQWRNLGDQLEIQKITN